MKELTNIRRPAVGEWLFVNDSVIEELSGYYHVTKSVTSSASPSEEHEAFTVEVDTTSTPPLSYNFTMGEYGETWIYPENVWWV